MAVSSAEPMQSNIAEYAAIQQTKDTEALLDEARLFSRQGEYDLAQNKLDQIPESDWQNPDVQIVQAYLFYYQGNYKPATDLFQNILNNYPEYTDAAEGLSLIERAQSAESTDKKRWSVTAGTEISRFSRSNQDSWNQNFIELSRLLENDKTVLRGKVTRYDQFNNIDSEYELGVDHYLNDRSYFYGQLALSPDANFRPDLMASASGEYRLTKTSTTPAIFGTLYMRYSNYSNTDVTSLKPGIRLSPIDGWGLSLRSIIIDQDDEKRTYGQEYRLDGQARDDLRFYLGYADAPETEAGVVVNTKSYFGGIAYDFNTDYTLRLGYAHDDRQDAYIRKIYNASLQYRF